MTKISIIGAGKVGSTTAFALLLENVCDELAIVDILENLAKGEALDLQQAFGSKKVSGGSDYLLTKDSDLILITAGVGRKPNMTRDDLFEINKKIIDSVATELKKYSTDPMIVTTTNPADRIASELKKYFSNVHVLGNEIDTMRFKWVLSKELKVPYDSIEAKVTGEHGERMIVHIDDVRVDGKKVIVPDKEKVLEETVNASKPVLELKGATYFAPAVALLTMIKNLLR